MYEQTEPLSFRVEKEELEEIETKMKQFRIPTKTQFFKRMILDSGLILLTKEEIETFDTIWKNLKYSSREFYIAKIIRRVLEVAGSSG